MEDPSKRIRKKPKRYMDSGPELEPAPKAPRRGSTAGRRRQHVAEPPEIDVVNDDDEFFLDMVDEDRRSEPSEHHSVASGSTSQTKARKSKGKAQPIGTPAKKKARKVVMSDSESDDYVGGEDKVVSEVEEKDDDYMSVEEEKPKLAKGKGKAAAKGPRGTKRKPKADPIESRTSVDSAATTKKRSKPSLKVDEELIDVVGESVSTPDIPTAVEKLSPATTSKRDSPAPALPKKLKLPTIKKNKLPGSGVGTPTSATATKPKLPLELGAGSKPGDIRKTQRAGTDLDLSNKSIYQELFKTASDGATPRTGLNRRTKEEERRKELNKLRDEWKAKRAAEAVHSFDLQAQFDKISRFEEKLRAERSAALYPNFMAAKWREVYDKEKRRQKELEWNEGGYPNGREEGEVR